jgi:hypothetical protein
LSVPTGLEEELGTARNKVAELRCCLGKVEDQWEALADGALAIWHVVEPVVPLRVNPLHTLAHTIRSTVSLGVHHGKASALATAQLRCVVHLGALDLGFSKTASATTRQAVTRDFAGFGWVLVAETDVDVILQ